jgi:hypothetical protein
LATARRPEKRGIGAGTKDFKRNGTDTGTVNKLICALEGAGVEFISPTEDKGSGVRFRSIDAERKQAGKKR